MQFVEYGKENSETIILLHGGGLSWWSYDEVSKALRDDFHVLLPILDGHAESDQPFTTIEANAKEIIDYVDKNFGGSVLLIGGLSLGAQVVLEILSQRRDICRYAIVESALVKPSRLTHFLIKPAIGGCYGLIKKRWFARLQFKALRIRQELFECYFTDTADIPKQDMIAFMQANATYFLKGSIRSTEAEVHIFVGAKENGAMRKSAEDIHRAMPNSILTVVPRLYHGELSINHGRDYAMRIRQIVGERKSTK